MIRRFRPDELAGAPDLSDAELGEVWATARELEAFANASSVGPSDGFEARVLAAVAAEPLPAPVSAAGHAARRGRIGVAAAALADAWRVAFGGGRPFAVRIQAFAAVFAVVVVAGSLGSLAVVGSWNALQQAPSPILSPSLSASPTPSVSPSPTPSATPTPVPTPSPTPAETTEPTDTAEPAGTPTGTSEGSGSGTVTPTATARRTDGPTPSATHEDRNSPEPTQTPESGGGGEGGATSSPTSHD